MQFTYPELLWALFLLLIPLFIHLFQLRRFKKTPFTNVKLLQKVVSESRKSNTLKKWLLLVTRLLLFASLIIAFAQLFFADKSAITEKETVIYLDDSFSMQAKNNNGTLLSNAVQELIKAIPKDNSFSLFTNERVFRNVTLKDIQNDLLTLSHTEKQLQLNEIYLKANTFFDDNENSIKNVVVVSDFQKRLVPKIKDLADTLQNHLVQLVPEEIYNIAIDTAYITKVTPNNIELTTVLSSIAPIDDTPVSLFNGEKLIAKTSAIFDANRNAIVVFSLPSNEVINGKIEILDMGLSYDNQLFFNINRKEKIKVLSIYENTGNYLDRIFTEDEFLFSSYSLKNLNYSLLASQNLIVLDELTHIPKALENGIKSFIINGGSVAVIPSINADLGSYNQLLTNFFSSSFSERIDVIQNITNISFSHPLFLNVFEKTVTNFQYPMVNKYFRVKTTAPKILSFANGDPFLVGTENIYVFSAPLSKEYSNFKNSPLIVPTFYNIGDNSLKLPDLYSFVGATINVDVPTILSKDKILTVTKQDYEFIPQQQSFANKVSLTFNENPVKDGIYSIKDGDVIIKNISFNHERRESELNYLNIEQIHAVSKQGSITSLFETMEKDNSVTELWKWFVILALLFALVEVLIQKYLK